MMAKLEIPAAPEGKLSKISHTYPLRYQDAWTPGRYRADFIYVVNFRRPRIRDPAYGLPRTPLLSTSVNRHRPGRLGAAV